MRCLGGEHGTSLAPGGGAQGTRPGGNRSPLTSLITFGTVFTGADISGAAAPELASCTMGVSGGLEVFLGTRPLPFFVGVTGGLEGCSVPFSPGLVSSDWNFLAKDFLPLLLG